MVRGIGTVGQAGGVADEGVACLRCACDKGAQDGEAAEAGIEDADGGWDERRLSLQGLFPSAGVTSAVR